jgi:hypothetical protein
MSASVVNLISFYHLGSYVGLAIEARVSSLLFAILETLQCYFPSDAVVGKVLLWGRVE